MTTRALAVRAAAWVCASALCAPWSAAGQALSSIEFSFSNPGARSLGLGGAFVALADDATAAVANPAGLVLIAEPEVSVETRSWHYSIPFTRGGRAAGQPTGFGIDTVERPLRADSNVDLAGLSFLSYVYPRKRWSFAFYRHQLANFEFGLETQGVFGPVAGTELTARSPIQRSDVDIELLGYGLAVAVRPIERLSLGLGISRFEPRIDVIGWDYLTDEETLESFFSRASFRPDRLIQIVELESRDPSLGIAAGFLWRVADRWSVGGVYRQAPRPTMEISLEAGPAHPEFPAGFRIVEGYEFVWRFPDVYGLGLTYRSRDGQWTGAVEWRRVEYSSLLESLLPQQVDETERLDDADEIHLGGEYAFFAGTSVIAIRAGIWHDPDHQFRDESDPAVNPYDRAIQFRGSDELHVAAGVGIALERFQLDLGVDVSERIDTIALSAIYRF